MADGEKGDEGAPGAAIDLDGPNAEAEIEVMVPDATDLEVVGVALDMLHTAPHAWADLIQRQRETARSEMPDVRRAGAARLLLRPGPTHPSVPDQRSAAVADPTGKPAPPPIPYIDRDRAPVIFFDQSPAVAHANGVVSLTLSTDVFVLAADGNVATEHAIVGHLKTSVAGARALRVMLDKALLIAEPVAGEAN